MRSGPTLHPKQRLQGVPSCANGPLINGILRKRWGWDGFVVSDYDAWSNLVSPQGFAQNLTAAAAIGINAGMDQEGGGTSAVEQLPAAVAAGATTAEAVAASFRRLFAARIRLGMLDPPTNVWYNTVPFDVCASAPHIALARVAARKGIAMYKNKPRKQATLRRDGSSSHHRNSSTVSKPAVAALPLAVGDFAADGSLAVIGPTADNANNLLGNYATASTSGPAVAVSILQGLQGWSATAAAAVKATAAAAAPSQPEKANGDTQAEVELARKRVGKISVATGCNDVTCNSTAGFAAAVSIAKAAKATVLVLGTRVAGHNRQDPAGPCLSKVACEGEGHDRNSTAFAGHQYALAAALAPVSHGRLICVFVHGGAMALDSLATDCDAILDAGFPGTQGGNGLADVIFGGFSPAGRAAVTWYGGDLNSDLPPYGEMDLYPIPGISKGITYRHYTAKPAVAFGEGLSYTQFAYSNLRINASLIGACDTVGVLVDVENTGAVDSDEVSSRRSIPRTLAWVGSCVRFLCE